MSFSITIDGRQVEAHEGEMLLAVARRAGSDIPTLCDHPAVEPFGACRLCVVDITRASWDGWKKLVTSCLFPAAPGLIVETQTDRVVHVRKNVLDLLRARCPQSDVIRRMAAEQGVDETSFVPREQGDSCILCGLCTRVCESAATAAIATVARGHNREIGTPWGGVPEDCIGCLACGHICPTGHIKFTDDGRTRSIWGRDFALARCADCGAALPLTEEQARFLAERQQMDPSYFARCADCQRRATAQTFGRMARWNRLGLEPEGEEVPR